MNDLIYRQTAVDALRNMAVPLYKDLACEDIWERDRTLDNAIEKMVEIPSIDAVPVIRCKDCKRAYWYKAPDGKTFCYCMEHGSYGNVEKDYCARAERREE